MSRRGGLGAVIAGLVLAGLSLLTPPAAVARDPGRWLLTGFSSVSNSYWQGVTSSPAGDLYFDGLREGLYRTAPSLSQTAAVAVAIPDAVKALEGYNHIGDISWDRAEGGRVLLPLECYVPGAPNGGNPCLTGAIGVADPATLRFRYYVKLDPAEIAKAMWVEASPDGRLLWTSSGPDLLAYSAADVVAANAHPGAPPIRAVRRLPRAVPPSGVAGAAFRDGRLLLAGARGETYQVWSVDVGTGLRRLEIELRGVMGEAEGLHATSLLGGELHWLIAPLAASPTFGPTVGLLHFAPKVGRPGLKVKAKVRRFGTLRPRVSIRVSRGGRPVKGATVTFAGVRAKTNRRGCATVRPALGVPGVFRALARKGGRRGLSGRFPIGYPPASAARTPAPAEPLR